MKRVLISLLIVVTVSGAATSATLAFFTSSQTISGSIISTGSLSFLAVLTDLGGAIVPNITQHNFGPGQVITRCLWIRNAGGLPGRFKFYRSGGSGATLGKLLTVSAVMNPPVGQPCSSTAAPSEFTGPRYETSNQSRSEWQDVVMYGGVFDKLDNSPIKLNSSDVPMEPGSFALMALEIRMTTGSLSSDTNEFKPIFTLFGMQKEGSDPGSGWDVALEPSPSP
jgi:hypothetical protein